jgi:hypothetical protein
MVDQRVRPGVDQPGVAVLEPNQVWRLPSEAAYFDDFTALVGLPHHVAMNAEMVTDGCLHV